MAAMSRRPRTDSWWEPTWPRLAAGTLVLFLVIMAFLVGRVRAGADPGLAREATGAPAQEQVAPASPGSGGSQAPGLGADPSDPFAQPQTDPRTGPGANGTSDGFGDAVPGQGQGLDDQDQGGRGAQSSDSPSTHVS